MALTPPQNDPVESFNVDVHGPGGMTPLMIASMVGSYGVEMPSSARDPDGVISTLVKEGAAINARTDNSGEKSIFSATTRHVTLQFIVYITGWHVCGISPILKEYQVNQRVFDSAPVSKITIIIIRQ